MPLADLDQPLDTVQQSQGELVQLSNHDLISQYVKAKQLADAAKEAMDHLKATILERVGDGDTLLGDNVEVWCPEISRKVVDYKTVCRLAGVDARLIAENTKTTTYRTVNVVWMG